MPPKGFPLRILLWMTPLFSKPVATESGLYSNQKFSFGTEWAKSVPRAFPQGHPFGWNHFVWNWYRPDVDYPRIRKNRFGIESAKYAPSALLEEPPFGWNQFDRNRWRLKADYIKVGNTVLGPSGQNISQGLSLRNPLWVETVDSWTRGNIEGWRGEGADAWTRGRVDTWTRGGVEGWRGGHVLAWMQGKGDHSTVQ